MSERHTAALALNLLPEVREGGRALTEQDLDDVRVWQSLRAGRARREHDKSLDQYRQKDAPHD